MLSCPSLALSLTQLSVVQTMQCHYRLHCLQLTLLSCPLSCSCSKERPTEFSPPTRARWGRWWGPRWTGWSRQWSGCCRSWSSSLQRVRPSGPPAAGRSVVGRRSYFDFLSDQFYQKNSWDCGQPGSPGPQPRSVCWPPGSSRGRLVCWRPGKRPGAPPGGNRRSWMIVAGCCWCSAASPLSLLDIEGLAGNLAAK